MLLRQSRLESPWRLNRTDRELGALEINQGASAGRKGTGCQAAEKIAELPFEFLI